MIKLVGVFEEVKIYESQLIGEGHGITLPELGIFLSFNSYSLKKDLWLLKHEFGHLLQYKEQGSYKFYTQIGAPSLWSAIQQNTVKNHLHKNHPVEVDANLKSYQYFNSPKDWPVGRFPIFKKD